MVDEHTPPTLNVLVITWLLRFGTVPGHAC